MIGFHPDCPPSVALLADHLDAALAAGEDLMAASLPARADLDEIDCESAPDALDAFVRRLLQLEASLLLRVLQARRLAVEIGRADVTLKAVGALFRAQTDALHELILRAGRTTEGGLVRAGDSHAYLRSRGLIAPEAAAPSPFESLSVGESFRVGGIAVLSQILDLVSSVLDLLDARFGLYAPDLAEDLAEALPVARASTDASGMAGDSPSLESVIAAVTGKALATSAARADDEPAEVGAGASMADALVSGGSEPQEAKDGAPIELAKAHVGEFSVTGGPSLPAASPPEPAASDAGAVPSAETQSRSASRSLTSLVAEIGTVS